MPSAKSASLPAFVLVAVILVISSLAEVEAVRRRKRSDDPAALQPMVENLAQQVNTLSSAVEALKAKQDSLSVTVAFFATANANTTVTSHGIMILPQVLANVGGGYNAQTGYFTAPVSGLYQFHATFMGDDLNTYFYAGIFVDSQALVTGISDMRHGFWDTPSMSVMRHVTSGQTVSLQAINSGVRHFHPYTSLSGFLVRAD